MRRAEDMESEHELHQCDHHKEQRLPSQNCMQYLEEVGEG